MIDKREDNTLTERASASNGFVWNALSKLIMLAGVAWVIFIFAREFSNLRDDFKIQSSFWLGYTVLAGVIALLMTVPIFRSLLRFYSGRPITYVYAGRLFFVAQLLRHLPGRFFGVAYLIKETNSQIPAIAMIRANLDVMFYSMTFNLLVAGMLILMELVSGSIAFVFAAGSLLVMIVAIKQDWIGIIIRRAIRLVPTKAEKYAKALTPHEPLPWRNAIMIAVFFVLIWGLYLSIWAALPIIFHGLADVNIWLLCATYAAAWVLGYITMITPGGLGVREAGFVAMSAKLTTLPNLTFLAVFLRLWQISIEFILFLAFVFVKPDTGPDNMTTADKMAQ